MGTLEKDLPKIVTEALHDEDKTTRNLVNVLLNGVRLSRNSDDYTRIKRILDDELDKQIETGLIDEQILEENN